MTEVVLAGLEADPEPGGEQRADDPVTQYAQLMTTLFDFDDDLDRRVFESDFAEPIDVDVGRVRYFVGAYRLAAGKDFVGDLLRGRPAGADVNAQVAFWAARIVARRQDDPAEGAEMADEGRNRGSRQDAALADHDAAEAVGGGDLGDDLDRLRSPLVRNCPASPWGYEGGRPSRMNTMQTFVRAFRTIMRY